MSGRTRAADRMASQRGLGVKAARTPIVMVPVATLAALVLAASLLTGCHDRDVARGAALYQAQCASCHGPNGQGQNPARPWGSLVPEQEGWIAPALDMRGHCYVHPRNQLFSIIRDGSPFPGTTMVGFKDRLKDDEIRDIVAYLETLWDKNTRREYLEREKLISR